MGSHYIQVGKLKVDQELLDIACPAAGYGETPPDPAVYCPANGYSQPEEVWEPPVEIPTPGDDQILLLCDDLEQGVMGLYCKANSGNILCEILTTDMVVLWSATNSTYHRFSFPTIDTSALYVVRLRPETAGSYITHFYVTSYTGYNADYRIFHAKINAPQITTMASAFYNITSIRKCEFLSNMNSLTTLYAAFRASGIESVTYPDEMNALTNIQYLYYQTTNLKICDLSSFPSSAITTMQGLLQESNVEELYFPASFPALTIITYLAYKCYRLKTVTMFTSAPLLETIDRAFSYCTILTQAIKFPPLPALLSAQYVGQYSGMSKLEFEGPSDSCTTMRDLISYSTVEELILPSSLNSVTNTGVFAMWYNDLKVKRIQLPSAMPLLTPNPTNFIYSINLNLLAEITECQNWGTGAFKVMFYSTKLSTFFQPNLRVSFLKFGSSSSARTTISSIEVDWANSVFTSGNVIYIYSSVMDATEMERIFTALPVVSGCTILIYGPGMATADTSIATAKGWNVVGST